LSQNIFNIPPHVILDEDTVWKEKPEVSDSSVKQCEDEIQKLTEKITAVLHLTSFVYLYRFEAYCITMPSLWQHHACNIGTAEQVIEALRQVLMIQRGSTNEVKPGEGHPVPSGVGGLRECRKLPRGVWGPAPVLAIFCVFYLLFRAF